jgi:monovalent cation:H+ antiporter-2, CPA2 family
LGETLGSIALDALGVNVVSVRRASGVLDRPSDDLRLMADDTLVLSGLPQPLAWAQEKLLGRR